MPSLRKLHAVLFGLLSFVTLAASQAAAQVPPVPPPDPDAITSDVRPGSAEGTGKQFRAVGGGYLDITLSAADPVTVSLTSIPRTVNYAIEGVAGGAFSTTVTLTGLARGASYYKYVDDLHSYERITADSSGQYEYTQDLTSSHNILIAEQPSTIFLTSTGFSSPVGTWNSVTKVGTLTQNVNQTIEIDVPGATLDGAGFAIDQTGGSYGVYVPGLLNLTIKNVTIRNFSFGIYLPNAQNTTIQNVVSTGNQYGTYAPNVQGTNVTGSTFSNNSLYGIYLANFAGTPLLSGNTFTGNGLVGLYLSSAVSVTMTGNTFTSNVRGGFYMTGTALQHFNHTIDLTNVVDGKPIIYVKNTSNPVYGSGTVTGGLYLVNCPNITVQDFSVSGNGQGVFCFGSTGSIQNVNASNNMVGIDLNRSGSLTVSGCTLANNLTGIMATSTTAGISISGNTITGSGSYGIQSSNGTSVSLLNNSMSSNVNGIVVSGAQLGTLSGNSVTGGTNGISINSSQNLTFTNNTMTGNTANFGLLGSVDQHYMSNTIDATNTTNGKPILYVKNSVGAVYDASSNAGAVYILNGSAVTVRNLTIANNAYGVTFWRTANSTIQNVNLQSCTNGAYLSSSDHNVIQATGTNTTNGVTLQSSSLNTVSGCGFTGGSIGIQLSSSAGDTLAGNTLTSQTFSAINFSNSADNVVRNNTINTGQANSPTGLYLQSTCERNLFEGNTFTNGYYGGLIYNSNNNRFIGNTYTNNLYGCWILSSSNNCLIQGNTITGGSYPIYGNPSNGDTIRYNSVSGSYVGVAGTFTNSLVYNNNFVNFLGAGVGFPVFTGTVFNLPLPIGGNYWSAWTTPDANLDGFVDVPYLPSVYSSGSAVPDNYPLARQSGWTNRIVRAVAGSGGTISPAGTVAFAVGANATFAITPNTGFAVNRLLVDGVNVGPALSYTFPSIAIDHQIEASFAPTSGFCANDSLVSWWPANGTAADIVDSNPGTLTNGATFVPGGHQGQAFWFDGTDDFVNVADNATLEGMARLTVATWFKFDQLPPARLQFILSKGSVNGTTTNAYAFWRDAGGHIVAALETNTTLTTISDPGVFSDTTGFHHAALTWDGATARLYLDGVLKGSQPISGSGVRNNTFPLTFGRRSVFNDFMFGRVDDVTLYRRSMNGAEIQDLVAQGICSRTVTASAGVNGTITPSGAVQVLNGQSQSFTIAGNAGYRVADVLVDGISVGTPTTYTFTNVTASHTISAQFAVNNTAPVLAAIGNKTTDEGVALAFNVNATDTDVPANVLTFSLDPGFPAGAAITSGGAFSWTPTEAQGPGDYSVTVRVADDGSPPLADTKTFSIHVNEVNQAPVLTPTSDKTVTEGTALAFTAVATDADIPAQTIAYGISSGLQPGMAIDGSSGAFSWTPSEAQGPGNYTVVLRATDTGSPALFGEDTLAIHVDEGNTAPSLAAIADQTVAEGSALTLTAVATDPDVPPNTLTYSLDSGAPAGASINSGSGAFSWTPTEAQGPGNYSITVRVSDGGTPPLEDDKTFHVVVTEVNTAPTLAAIADQTVNEGTALTFTASGADTDVPTNGLSYVIESGSQAGMAIHGTTGVFSWTPTEAQGPGDYTVTLRVSDDGTPQLSATTDVHIHVNEVNQAPSLAAIPDQTVAEGSALSFTASATDGDLPANTLTYSLDSGAPAGAAITSAGAFSWTPTEAQGPGNYTITVRVSDGASLPLDDAKTFHLAVTEVNNAPTLAAIANQTVNEGTALTFTASGADTDVPANGLTYSIESGFQTGMSIGGTTGVFTWTPTEEQGPGSYTVTLRVSDDGMPQLSGTTDVHIHVNEVNQAPSLAAIADQTIAEASALTLTASATDSDLPANTLTYSLDSGAPAGSSISASGAFSWTPTEAQGPGTYAITVRVSDGSLEDSKTFHVAVTEVNNAPTLAAIADKSVDEGSALLFTASGSDTDLPTNSLSYDIAAGSQIGMAIDGTTGGFSWTPTEAQGPGDYTVTLRVHDDGTPQLSGTTDVHIHVNEVNLAPSLAAIPNQTIAEGSALTLTASATDPDLPANTLSYSLDTGTPVGASINTTSGIFSWTPTEAQGPGSYPITVRVSDVGSLTDSKTFNVSVTETNQAPTLAPIANQTVNEGQALSFTATATDLDVPANTVTLTATHTISGTLPTITSLPGQLTFSWTPSEVQGPGDYDVTVRATDNGVLPLSDQKVVHIHVNESNQNPVITVPAALTVDEGATVTFTASSVDADLPANTLTYALVKPPTPATATIVAATGAFSWPTVDNSVQTVRVSVSDGAGGSATGDVGVTVRNVAPTVAITGPASGSIYPIGTAVTFTGTFADPGTADTHTATWAFDTATQAGTVNEAAHTVTATQSFTTAGVYLIRLTVTDDDGGAGAATDIAGSTAMIVVYDPNAGFVTGGGWITSAPGAYTPDPSLTGKANFGFVSKYKKGASVPDGETEFEFKVASMNFHSTSYDWLVIAGSKAQYKGTGTINNAGNYKFMLTGTDGHMSGGGGVDKLRMKIWDAGTSQVIYDNQFGAPDTATASTALGGGSIVIHQAPGTKSGDGPVSIDADGLPIRFALYHSYPNPFAASTRFRFDLAEESVVSAAVYDVLGRRVKELAGATLPTGRYEHVWDGRDVMGRPVAKGVYFYRIQARGVTGGARHQDSRKVIVSR